MIKINWKNILPKSRIKINWEFAALMVLFMLIATCTFVPFKGLVYIIAFLLPIVALIAVGTMGALKKSDTNKKGFLFMVPAKNAWVTRWTLFSNPGDPLAGEDPKMYRQGKEGWNWWMPGVMEDLGTVSLQPIQRDIPAVKVNSCDDQVVSIDTQIVTSICGDDWSPTRFVTNVPGSTSEEKEVKRREYEDAFLETALNNVCKLFNAEELTDMKIDPDPDKKKPETVRRFRLYPGGEEKSLNAGDPIPIDKYAVEFLEGESKLKQLYGLKFNKVGVQRVVNPEVVQAALERKTAARIELKSMPDEAAAMKQMIDKTGANPNIVMLGQMVGDLLRPFSRKGKTKSKSKERGGKDNESD